MKIVGVMGSGKDPWIEYAQPLGEWLAGRGFNLLTGGGQGVMYAVARAFCSVQDRTGKSIAVVPTRADELVGFVPIEGYPNPFVEVPIVTPLPRMEPDSPPGALSRNYVNVLSSDVVIALPGGPGTRDEIQLASRFGKPLMCLGPESTFQELAFPVRHSPYLDEIQAFILATTNSH